MVIAKPYCVIAYKVEKMIHVRECKVMEVFDQAYL